MRVDDLKSTFCIYKMRYACSVQCAGYLLPIYGYYPSMYVYMYVCMYVCMRAYICEVYVANEQKYPSNRTAMIYVYIYMCVYIYMHVYTCMYVFFVRLHMYV